MSSKAITTITCDQCAQLGQPETLATTSIVVKFNGDPARQIDLCDDHGAEVEALQALVRCRGVYASPTAAQRVLCPICGQPCRNGTGLAAHSRARHGTVAA